MRRIISATFISMDGIMQAPGGPTEDPTHGFTLGGWTATYWDEVMGKVMGENFAKPFDLLLGRKTYEIFAAHWPHQKADDPVRKVFDAAKKYVATRTLKTFDWVNTESLGGDPVASLKKIKAGEGSDLLIQGSSDFVQTLLANDLIDQIGLWTFPLTLGHGKRLFGQGAMPVAFKLTSSQASTTGVVMSTYIRDGAVKTGSFQDPNPSQAELARRAKLS
ncbi:MAG: dihydrofolate reductase family protein [Rhodospirillaceae bacterium]